MKLSRREFLVKGTALLATLGLTGPFSLSAQGLIKEDKEDQETPKDGNVLVMVQLSGGNDGLNTVIPYGFGGYFDARPTLKITDKEVLALDNRTGFHPSLTGLNDLYSQGKVAVIQGVGYPQPDHSHFRSMEIWQTAEPEKIIRSGWLSRYMESSLSGVRNPLKAIQIGGSGSKAFLSNTLQVPVIQSIETYSLFDPKTPQMQRARISQAFLDMYDPSRQATSLKVACTYGAAAYQSVEAIQSLTGTYANKVEYPKTSFARDLQTVSKLLAGGSGTRVFYVQLGGFDDHAQEKAQHAKLLKDLDEGLKAFYEDLMAQDLQDRVMTMTFSEFGRRVKENGSGGTDHGTAGPVLVMGGRVQGGLYGLQPSLTDLDNGDLKYAIDFRSLYYTVIEDWLKGDAKSVLGRTYERIPFV